MSFILFLFLIITFSCQNKSKDKKFFAKVGKNKISQESYSAFDIMKRQYPSGSFGDNIFPGDRSFPTLCIETEILFIEAKSFRDKIKKRGDWKWKEKYFPAQHYLENILDMNLGFLQKDIEEYYNNHKEDYKKVIKVKVGEDTVAVNDSASDSVNVTYKDSIAYNSIDDMKNEITQDLFWEKYPPDSAFIASMTDTSDTATDTSLIKTQWINKIRQDIPQFFMEKFFKKTYNKEYPDSLDEIYGEGKVITPEDFEVILMWIHESDRELYKNDENRRRYLIEWLLKWKLFYKEAEECGYTEKEEIKAILDWALKYDVASAYVYEKLLDDIKNGITVDTAMCIFEHWDKTYKPGIYPDSAELKKIIESGKETKIKIAFDEKIHSLRTETGVTFLQSDDIDDKTVDPDSIAALADSLYGAGNSSDAETQYKKLISNFLFTKKGKDALVEVSKILTEKELYWEAIHNYRRFLLVSDDFEKRCNIFFMIGFVFGEYLDKPELAEASYKWILKNTPDCELSDDAEFMCLHLDEPMIGVEELRAEAKRQGREVEEEPVNDNADKSTDNSKS
jgi:hypothetical protein